MKNFEIDYEPKVDISVKKLEILRNGQVISDMNNPVQNVIVGERIDLTTRLVSGSGTVDTATMNNRQWTIPGTRIANYVVTYTSPSAASSGVLTELTDQNLTQTSIQFYWVDGADSRDVQFSARLGNKPYTATGRFNVSRPTVNLSASLGQVDVRLEDDNYWWLRFGNPSFPRISFIASSFSGPQGNRSFVQIATPLRRYQLPTGNWCRWAGVGLDKGFPYDSNFNSTEDSPGTALNNGDLKATASDTFKMYYMFRPTGVNSPTIWVPLKVINWSWSGEAIPANNTEWRLRSPLKNADPSVDTTEFPQWTQIVQQIRWEPEGTGYQCQN